MVIFKTQTAADVQYHQIEPLTGRQLSVIFKVLVRPQHILANGLSIARFEINH